MCIHIVRETRNKTIKMYYGYDPLHLLVVSSKSVTLFLQIQDLKNWY